MATSKCAKCDSTRFEMKEAKILRSNYPHSFVQCAQCGAVVGTVPDTDTNYLIRRLAEQLKITL